MYYIDKTNLPFYGATKGSFGPLHKHVVEDWHDCRETFHEESDCNEFVFVVKKEERERVIKFLKKFQDKLGLPEKYRVKFDKTGNPEWMYVKIGRFWKKNIRRSLLTALLRAGRNYEGNFRKALKDSKYFEKTMKAVDLFLSGRTVLKKRIEEEYSGYGFLDEYQFGWKNIFTKENPDDALSKKKCKYLEK